MRMAAAIYSNLLGPCRIIRNLSKIRWMSRMLTYTITYILVNLRYLSRISRIGQMSRIIRVIRHIRVIRDFSLWIGL